MVFRIGVNPGDVCQKQTYFGYPGMSALAPEADVRAVSHNVRYVPIADNPSLVEVHFNASGASTWILYFSATTGQL